MMNRFAGLAALLGLSGLLWAVPAQALDLQGHRGTRGLMPENTLASFQRAVELGVTTLELDIAITRDGVLVIHHDLELNPAVTRDASGQWIDRAPGPIHAMSWAQLQTYDVGRLRPGSTYAAQFPAQQAIDGTRIPRLSDLFDWVRQQGHHQLRFAIETKLRADAPDKTLPPQAFAQAVVDEVRKAGMAGRVQILSFDWRSLQEVQRIAPEIPTVYLTAQQRWMDNVAAGKPEGSAWTAGFQYRDHGSIPRMIKAAGGCCWSVYHGDIDAARVREAQGLGLKVLVWTVNDAPTMERLLDMGIDGLITDRPDVAQGVLRARNIVPR